MTDCGFPIITYQPGVSARERGYQHGETFRTAIAELVEIRTGLMREKNQLLTADNIENLANQQWLATRKFDPTQTDELQAIAEAANISTSDIVVLNNYTDFRDIQLPDEGCSLAYINSQFGPIVGQTWDMHGSAKNYVCCIDLCNEQTGRTILFSVVGCVGMMGFNSVSGVMGVNNINTDGAQPGVLWPVIVRSVLENRRLQEMANRLCDSPKTSGHNYLLAVKDHAQMWEVAPGCNDKVDELFAGEYGHMFHTNHCLGENMKNRETTISQNSTTHIRYELLEKKIVDVKTFEQMYDLMNDHENYPKSICSNFQTDAQDPSITCGGAVGHLLDRRIVMWRGDKLHDENYVEHEFNLFPSGD